MKICYSLVFCSLLLADAVSALSQQVDFGKDNNEAILITNQEQESSPIHLRGRRRAKNHQSSRGLFVSAHTLQNVQNNQCVGFGSSSTLPPIKGTKAVFEPCASAPSFVYGGPDGRQLVVLFEDDDYKNNNNKKARMCLDSIGNVSLQPCRDHYSQVWLPSRVEDAERRNGQMYYRFFNYGSGKWLDSDMKLVKDDADNEANERQWFGGLDASFIGSEQGSS